jgi:organic hydroperoxide reductase OsmC/OhrA
LAKRFEYAAVLAEDGRLLADGADPLEPGETWTPEHLVLAGLMRCTLKSLAFHAERSGVSTRGSARSEAVVARREEDGRFAFVEVECTLDVELDPTPVGAELAELLALAERDCFVGASLTSTPRYQWSVNGEAMP